MTCGDTPSPTDAAPSSETGGASGTGSAGASPSTSEANAYGTRLPMLTAHSIVEEPTTPSSTPTSSERRRPGRPRRYDERINTCIRLDKELHAELSNAAAERDLSVNYLVSRAIEEFLDRLIPADEWKLTRD